MAQPAGSKILQVCSVEPIHGMAPSLSPTSLPLTFFDLLWFRFPPVERLFFYELPNNSTTSFFDSVLPNLKHSLSLTLQHFFPLAGNIIWPNDSPNPIIKYFPGDAVSFTIVESNADFYHLCSDLCEAAERRHLIPQLPTSHGKASVLALKVTLFPSSGFCIGITTHHAAMDGKSSTLFMKSWAYACLKLEESPWSSLSLPEHLIPFFDRSVITDPKGLGEIYSNEWLKHGGPNNRSVKVWETFQEIPIEATRCFFELTPSHFQKLKQYAQSKLKKKVHLSTFSVACAYLIACLVRAEQTKSDGVVCLIPVDCRSRLNPPIVPTYFGNCIAGGKAVADTKNLLGSDGFIVALEEISEALNRLEEGVLNGAEAWVSNMQNKMEGRILSIAGSPRFEVYGIDFGWGRPKKVDLTSIDKTGAFSLSESRSNNGGIEIGMVLGKREMEALRDLFAQGLETL